MMLALPVLLEVLTELLTAPGLLEHTRDRVNAQVELLKRRPKREPDKVVARRVEQVPAVRGLSHPTISTSHR